MERLFRRLPLSFKLILIGIIPLAFIIYLTLQVYEAKNKNIAVIEGNINRINQIGDLTTLIRHLQQEQKLSFDVLKKNMGGNQLIQQRMYTDTMLNKLRRSNDYVLKGFEEYTSLHNLKDKRNKIDSGLLTADLSTHFYSNTIFRLNTLITTPYSSLTVLGPFYDDIQSQKLLTEITTYLGIIRTNIYNVLTTRQYMAETLLGTRGAFDVYKSYETELKLKASASTLKAYTHIRNDTELKPTLDYMNGLFATFKFDSTYTAEQWWTVSEKGIRQLLALRETVQKSVNKNIDKVYRQEIYKRDRTLLLLTLISVIVLSLIAYTITNIAKMLSELKQGAEKIALGGSGLQFNIFSKDSIGSLAESISKIDENNIQLTNAAEEIGKGNFVAAVQTRSNDDILANAIITMRDNLQSSIKAIEEREKQFKLLADLMPQIVWTADAKGEIDYYNKQWFEYAGDLDASSVIHAADIEITDNTWAKALKEGKDFSIELRMLNQITRHYRWFLVRAIPIKDANGSIIKWFGTSTDIHERKTMSEDLEKLVQKRTVELQRSNDDLLQFAHIASHDMKEPLRKVRFFADRLSSELADQTSDKVKSWLAKINIAVQRLMTMIEGVLEFSTINNDERPFETIDLNTIMAGIVSDLEIAIQQKGAQITFTNLPAIKGVPVLIHQLFYNLIVNALKFSKDGVAPIITIKASKIKLDDADLKSPLHVGDAYLEITIEDNGIGFNEIMGDKVFDVFARLHARDKYEGTGLGLALCKKIMQRHDGWIYAKSEEGKGTTFHLLLHETSIADNKNSSVALLQQVAS